MALRVAVQMDPIETVNIAGDSSFALMLSAQARGHAVWHYDVELARLAGRANHRLGLAHHSCARVRRAITLNAVKRTGSTSPPTSTWC